MTDDRVPGAPKGGASCGVTAGVRAGLVVAHPVAATARPLSPTS